MKQYGKPIILIVCGVIVIIASLMLLFGFEIQDESSDHTWSGVKAVFVVPDSDDMTYEQLKSAADVIKKRLDSADVSGYDVSVNSTNNTITVKYPKQDSKEDLFTEEGLAEFTRVARLTFREGTTANDDGQPEGGVIIEGRDVKKADVTRMQKSDGVYQYLVKLELNESSSDTFADATSRLAGTGTPISIWIDDTMISAPIVNEAITSGEAVITGNFTYDEAKSLADKINSGALPFRLEMSSFKSVSPD